eukprot:5696610-Lingulodinium_polyedra.AAC.1
MRARKELHVDATLWVDVDAATERVGESGLRGPPAAQAGRERARACAAVLVVRGASLLPPRRPLAA